MSTLKNLLFTILLSIPISLIAQDTLVAEIRVIRTPNEIEVSYSKDLRYSDETIARFISQMFTPEIKPEEQHEPKIKKI